MHGLYNREVCDLISAMLDQAVAGRPPVAVCARHPCFWDGARRGEFVGQLLCALNPSLAGESAAGANHA